MWVTRLAAFLLQRGHGVLVSTVGECLMHCPLTVKEIASETKLSKAKIKNALLVLTQHGLVDFKMNKQNQYEYAIYVDRVINQIYFHREAKSAGLLYGDAAEIMVEELTEEGRMTMEELVNCVTDKLNTAIKAQEAGLKEIQPSYIQDKFERLVATHFIKRCSVPVKNDKGQIDCLQPPPKNLLFTIPPKAAGNAPRVKQEPTESCSAPKKPRVSLDESQQISADNTETIYWEVNHPRFHQLFRDQMIVSAVGSSFESENAAEIVRCILRLCEKTTDPNAEITFPVSFNEIYSQLQKEKMMTSSTLEQWLKLMTDSLPEFISKACNSGGGMYVINTFKALQALCSAHIVSVVEERHGSKARRIIQVVMKNKNMEQEMLERVVLMPGKQSRQLIFSLIQDHFIRFTPLSKMPDQAAARNTYLLLNVDLNQVVRMLLENSYQTLRNLLMCKEYMLNDSRRLLEKQERIEAILVSLDLPASYAHGEEGDGEEGGLAVDEVKKEQVDAIMETVTPAERQQLKKIKALTYYFEHAEGTLVGSTIFTLTSYLTMANKPPPPKRVKNLLD